MFALVVLLIIGIAVTVLFVGLKKLKTFWKKVVFFTVWILAFCGHDLLIGVIFTSDASKYAKITVYDHIRPKGVYVGEMDYSKADRFWIYKDILKDGFFYEYKRVRDPYERLNYDHRLDDRYFRVYLDDNTSKDCLFKRNVFYHVAYESISKEYIESLAKEFFSNLKNYEDIDYKPYENNDMSKYSDEQRAVINKLVKIAKDKFPVNKNFKGYDYDDRFIAWAILEFKNINKPENRIEKLSNLDDKCIARIEIKANEISRIELKTCYDPYYYTNSCSKRPDISNKRGEFYYGSYIIDNDSGKILADNIYAKDYVDRTYSVWGLINNTLVSLGAQSSGGTVRVCGGENLTTSLKICNEDLIKIYFKG